MGTGATISAGIPSTSTSRGRSGTSNRSSMHAGCNWGCSALCCARIRREEASLHKEPWHFGPPYGDAIFAAIRLRLPARAVHLRRRETGLRHRRLDRQAHALPLAGARGSLRTSWAVHVRQRHPRGTRDHAGRRRRHRAVPGLAPTGQVVQPRWRGSLRWRRDGGAFVHAGGNPDLRASGQRHPALPGRHARSCQPSRYADPAGFPRCPGHHRTLRRRRHEPGLPAR